VDLLENQFLLTRSTNY